VEEKDRLVSPEAESSDSVFDLKEYMKQHNITATGGEKIKITGKDGDMYSETETTLSTIWAKVLEIEEIDIYTNFHSLGGNSVRAAILIQVLDTVYPQMLEISDIFTYSTVAQMSAYIEQKQSGAVPQASAGDSLQQGDTQQDEIISLLESLENGESSIDSALEMLLQMEGSE
jgi:acyl carrier protein